MAERIMGPVVVRHPGTDRVRTVREISYGSSDPLQRLDIYLPSGASGSPMIFLVHGWADIRFRPKERGIFASWARLWAARGVAAIMFNHRLGARGEGWSAASDDLELAVAAARREAPRHRLDPDRFAFQLFSGGGDLLSGAVRLSSHSDAAAILAYYPLLTRASVESLGTDSIAPMLLVRAGRDEIPGLLPAFDRFVAEGLAAGLDLTVIDHSAGTHGFDNRTDDLMAPAVICDTIDFVLGRFAEKAR